MVALHVTLKINYMYVVCIIKKDMPGDLGITSDMSALPSHLGTPSNRSSSFSRP